MQIEDLALPKRLKNEKYLDLAKSFSITRKYVETPSAIHWHEFYEIELILSGEGCHKLNGKLQKLQRGSLFLLTPSDFHEITLEKGTSLELINIKFSDEMLSDAFRELLYHEKVKYHVQLEAGIQEQIEYLCNRLLEEYKQEKHGKQIVIRGLLECIVVDIIRTQLLDLQINTSDMTVYGKGALHMALTYIQHHFREPIRLEDIAGRIYLSPNYFSEFFHKTVGTPFQIYLLQLRLNFAKTLLCTSQLQITQICLASGFNSLSHFTKTFKKTFGKTPSAYRKKTSE